MSNAKLLGAARQLLKSRLRHFIFSSKAVQQGHDERVWRSLLLVEDAVLERSEREWREAREGMKKRPSDIEMGEALRLASADVCDMLGPDRTEQLQPLIDSFVGSCRLIHLFDVPEA